MVNNITDLNVTEIEDGKFSSNLGTAHELFVTGILMRLGFDVSVSGVKGGPYDLLIEVYTDGLKSNKVLKKAQVKTCGSSLKFIGGIRGGVDRDYSSGGSKLLISKKYKYSETHNDIILGIQKDLLDIYIVPTQYVGHFGDSRSLKKLQPLKNNWEILKNWNINFLSKLFKTLPE
jgi:hypothetical protein